MSDAEMFELVAVYVSNCISSFTVYLSLVFSYLTVAYLIAPKLTRVQCVLATSIYLLGAASCIATLLYSLSVLAPIVDNLTETSQLYRQVVFGDPHLWFLSMAAITVAGLIGSVVFFFNIRHTSVSSDLKQSTSAK